MSFTDSSYVVPLFLGGAQPTLFILHSWNSQFKKIVTRKPFGLSTGLFSPICSSVSLCSLSTEIFGNSLKLIPQFSGSSCKTRQTEQNIKLDGFFCRSWSRGGGILVRLGSLEPLLSLLWRRCLFINRLSVLFFLLFYKCGGDCSSALRLFCKYSFAANIIILMWIYFLSCSREGLNLHFLTFLPR